jgi:hypothetical protein
MAKIIRKNRHFSESPDISTVIQISVKYVNISIIFQFLFYTYINLVFSWVKVFSILTVFIFFLFFFYFIFFLAKVQTVLEIRVNLMSFFRGWGKHFWQKLKILMGSWSVFLVENFQYLSQKTLVHVFYDVSNNLIHNSIIFILFFWIKILGSNIYWSLLYVVMILLKLTDCSTQYVIWAQNMELKRLV